MKRTLAISLWMALGTSAVAQNPAVIQKNVQTAVKASASTQATGAAAKPSPATVKVAPVTASKPAVVAVKPVAVAVKPSTVQTKTTAPTKPAVVAVQATPAKTVAMPAAKTTASPAVKPVAVPAAKIQGSAPVAHQAVAAPAPHADGVTKGAPPAKADPFKSAKAKTQPTVAMKTNSTKTVAVKDKADEKKATAAIVAKTVGQAGRRDPFISPVVNMSAVGSGCSSGKRCLAIDQIALRGIVKSDNGMIAVVVNATDKAYFLRENDPVFNGYVVRITGDSIVFKETFHDRLGKPLTRDITKTISRPVA
jgi:Tfp pilus assembly protein PilP